MRAYDAIVKTRDLDRLDQCPAAGVFSLPKGVKPPTNPGMWWGIYIHRFLEYSIERSPDFAMDYIKRKFKRATRACQKIDVEYLRALPGVEAEIDWAHNVLEDTTRRLPPFPATYKEFDRSRETFCKADLIFWDDLPHVADFKCGNHKISPLNHCQLEGMALALARETGMDQVRMSIIAVPSSGILTWRTVTLERNDLEAIADRERRVFLRVMDDRRRYANGEDPAFVTGSSCERCKLRPTCPAHGAPAIKKVVVL